MKFNGYAPIFKFEPKDTDKHCKKHYKKNFLSLMKGREMRYDRDYKIEKPVKKKPEKVVCYLPF